MRKLIVLLAAGMFFVPCVLASSSVSVRVSFTIPERIETGDHPCDKNEAQKSTNVEPQETQTDIATTVSKIVRAGQVCLLKTTLPK